MKKTNRNRSTATGLKRRHTLNSSIHLTGAAPQFPNGNELAFGLKHTSATLVLVAGGNLLLIIGLPFAERTDRVRLIYFRSPSFLMNFIHNFKFRILNCNSQSQLRIAFKRHTLCLNCGQGSGGWLETIGTSTRAEQLGIVAVVLHLDSESILFDCRSSTQRTPDWIVSNG